MFFYGFWWFLVVLGNTFSFLAFSCFFLWFLFDSRSLSLSLSLSLGGGGKTKKGGRGPLKKEGGAPKKIMNNLLKSFLAAALVVAAKTKRVKKHCKNCEKLPREHLIGCQGVTMFLLKDPFKVFFGHKWRFVIIEFLSQFEFLSLVTN